MTGTIVIVDGDYAVHYIHCTELRFARKYVNKQGATVIEYQLAGGPMHEILSRPDAGVEHVFNAIKAGGDHWFHRSHQHDRWREQPAESQS